MEVNSSSNESGRCGAGVLFMAADTGRFLFLKRSGDSDNPGTWCCPGGGVEDNETIGQAVRRECAEEIGFEDNYDLLHMHRDVNNGYTFHNHLATVPSEFVPTLNSEHTDYVWADEIPENIHPRLAVSLDAWQERQNEPT